MQVPEVERVNFSELASNAARWLSGEEDSEGMVVSCRARLARNISTISFAPKATIDDQELVIDRVLSAAQRSRHMRSAAFFKKQADGYSEASLGRAASDQPGIGREQRTARCAL